MTRRRGAGRRSGSGSSAGSPPPSFPTVHSGAAGVDVGSRRHHVAVPADRDPMPVQTFETFTDDLLRLADWLAACGVTTVAMESTGVYWIPLYELLERRGFEVVLVDARRLKTVPGRKSDVLDCQWLQQLHTFGLLSPAFRPDDATCELRSYLRQRQMLVDCAARHVQHMQKALEQMNLKLTSVITDVTGRTGLAIVDAILAGERDPLVLARLRDPRCKNGEETIARALHGNWREDHLFELRQARELYRVYREKLAECDTRIEAHLRTFPDRSGGRPLPKRKAKRNTNAPRFDAREQLHRLTGVDLTRLQGIDANIALKVVAEIGTDVSRWPTEKHFASWLCLCPGSHRSGRRRGSGKSRRSANRAAAALRLAAQSLERSHSALGAFYRRLKNRLGPPKAITATAHKLARLIYNMLRHGTEYVDVGEARYEARYRLRVIAGLHRRARQLGYVLTPAPPDAT